MDTWDNLDTLRLNVVTHLLKILWDKGHSSLLLTAQSLLGTKHRILQKMKSNKNTDGQYFYIGIEYMRINNLTSGYWYASMENEICVFCHIDGMQIYNNSQVQVWPIIMKIVHKRFICESFVVALYCDDSKPASVQDFFIYFITEGTELINLIDNLYKKVFFQNTQNCSWFLTRSFIKCIKPHSAFYACKRCSVKEVSVGEKTKKNIPRNKLYQASNTKEPFDGQNQL